MIQGIIDPNFWHVARSLQRQVFGGGGGAAVCVYHEGRKVVDVWAGDRDDRGNQWKEDTMAMSFSTSKGFISTLTHILADRGEIDYDEPVATYWPRFATAGKGSITVREAMSHRAGLARIRPMIDCGRKMLDWDHMLAAVENAEPDPHLLGVPAYHGLTYGWLIGGLLQHVTGKSLPELIKEELADPLGLDGAYIGADDEAKARAATLAKPSERMRGIQTLLSTGGLLEKFASLGTAFRDLPLNLVLIRDVLVPAENPDVFWHADAMDTPMPAANGLFTARSLARLYAMIAEGGTLDGQRIMSSTTVHHISEIQTRERDRVLVFPMHWRLGFHSALTTRGRVHTGFGHFGYGGSGAWCDPERRLSVAMVNNQMGGGPFGDYRIAELGNAALRSARIAKGLGETVGERAWQTALSANPLLNVANSNFQR
jgi:CubicO group peptidase (beta-lactamase class C family)